MLPTDKFDEQDRPVLLSSSDQRELSRLLSLFSARQAHHYQTMARLTETLAANECMQRQRWAERDSAEMNALIAQYESLRNESLNTINNRIQTLMIGIAAVAAVAGGALTIDDPKATSGIVYAVFCGAIPLVCVFVLLVWLTEAIRANRVGYFLAADVESRINAKLGRLVLTWEAALWTRRKPRDEMFGPSMIALVPVGIVAVASPVFGAYLLGQFGGTWSVWVLSIGIPWALLIGSVIYVWSQRKRLRNNPLICSTWPGEDDAAARKHG